MSTAQCISTYTLFLKKRKQQKYCHITVVSTYGINTNITLFETEF